MHFNALTEKSVSRYYVWFSQIRSHIRFAFCCITHLSLILFFLFFIMPSPPSQQFYTHSSLQQGNHFLALGFQSNDQVAYHRPQDNLYFQPVADKICYTNQFDPFTYLFKTSQGIILNKMYRHKTCKIRMNCCTEGVYTMIYTYLLASCASTQIALLIITKYTQLLELQIMLETYTRVTLTNCLTTCVVTAM